MSAQSYDYNQPIQTVAYNNDQTPQRGTWAAQSIVGNNDRLARGDLAPRYNGGSVGYGRENVDGRGGVASSSYDYRSGDSESDFIKRNNANDWKSGVALQGGSIGFAKRAIGGRRAFRRAKAQEEMLQRQYEESVRARDYGRTQDAQRMAGEESDRQRNQTLAALERSYASPARAQARDDNYNAEVGAATTSAQYDYGEQSKADALDMVRRGKLGSSTDAENRAKLHAGTQQRVEQAAAQAGDRRTSLQVQDDTQYQALRRAILSGDPQAAARYQAQAQAGGNNIDRLLAGGAASDRQRILASMGMANNMELVGGLADAGAAGVNSYYS